LQGPPQIVQRIAVSAIGLRVCLNGQAFVFADDPAGAVLQPLGLISIVVLEAATYEKCLRCIRAQGLAERGKVGYMQRHLGNLLLDGKTSKDTQRF